MSESQPISDDRQRAILIMKRCGWTHDRESGRKGGKHIFKMDDSGGWFRVAAVTHGNLSTSWAFEHCDSAELRSRVRATQEAWLRDVLPLTSLESGE